MDDPDYIDFIVEGQYSVIRRWLRAGAEAWRLDVADELPDEFIARIRRVMMEEKPESFSRILSMASRKQAASPPCR